MAIDGYNQQESYHHRVHHLRNLRADEDIIFNLLIVLINTQFSCIYLYTIELKSVCPVDAKSFAVTLWHEIMILDIMIAKMTW